MIVSDASTSLDALLRARLPHVETTLLIGSHAQRHFLGPLRKR